MNRLASRLIGLRPGLFLIRLGLTQAVRPSIGQALTFDVGRRDLGTLIVVNAKCTRDSHHQLGGLEKVPGAFGMLWGHHGSLSSCVALAVIQSTASSLVAKPSIRRSWPS